MLEYFDEFVSAKLLRFPDGEYADGIWVSGDVGDPIDIFIIAPQPITEQELQMLTDGEHIKDFRKTYCVDLLRVRKGDKDADRIEYNNVNYEIHNVSDRNVLGDYYKVIMRKLNA